jgi:hypothetical protein
MIQYWLRELMGWLLVVLGLMLFLLCVVILLNPRPSILEAPVICGCGFVVFRGGIHILKVAVAARIAMETQAEQAKQQQTDKRAKKPAAPWDW